MLSDPQKWRHSTQPILPSKHPSIREGQYDIYPAWGIGSGKIEQGFEALASRLAGYQRVLIDGYVGVVWTDLQQRLNAALRRRGLAAEWHDVAHALKPADEIEKMCRPFLGGADPLFGTRFTGELREFFDPIKLDSLARTTGPGMQIAAGCGAALIGWEDACLVYVDLPKNEIQFRARVGSVTNLGCQAAQNPQAMYKRFYFIDWPALNDHKAHLLPRIDLIVDHQHPDAPAFMSGGHLRESLKVMSRNYFRVRPWFEPGPWGGQWIKRQIPTLPQDAPNYAWSFELIVPENGLLFESDGQLLEASFDFLMFQDSQAILGRSADRFGFAFPIRFDLLDTFDGGNLSLQCHPRPEYARKHFGEPFTQDETYYILDCREDARVFLGFHDNIDPAAFRLALDQSLKRGEPVEVEAFVQSHAAHRHDLFLIPSGTIHCSGTNNLVLEISATPYIFTFKMYDWMRMGLDGLPRPLNLDRAFENLRFDRKGPRAGQELISEPRVLREKHGWRLMHLPTHAEHFYDVHRFDIMTAADETTDGSCHVLNLVEGESVLLQTENGLEQRFSYAETFVVPAAAERYRLVNTTGAPIRVVKAFIK